MKNFIWNLFPQQFKDLPHSDKYAHAILGIILFVTITLLFTLNPNTELWRDRTSFALVITMIIAYVNEVIDQKKGGTGSFWDIGATVLIPFFITLTAHIIENGQ